MSNKIYRNTTNWVANAEQSCTFKKVKTYFANSSDPSLSSLKTKFENFCQNYIFNSNKPFTIRTLANQMKHNHSINFKEFYVPNDLNINLGGQVINLKNANLGLSCTPKFYDKSIPNVELGEMNVRYRNDLIIDIKYTSNEEFFAEDYLRLNNIVSIDEVYSEAIDYGNALALLYDDVFTILEPQLNPNPFITNVKKVTSKSFNLDNHFNPFVNKE